MSLASIVHMVYVLIAEYNEIIRYFSFDCFNASLSDLCTEVSSNGAAAPIISRFLLICMPLALAQAFVWPAQLK